MKPSQAEIATGLGMSEAAVSKFVRRGMPTDSVEAARDWHHRNVRPRMSRNPARLYAAEIQAVHDLWPIARAALEAGKLEVVRPAIKAALRAVPEAARDLILVDVDVANAMCAEWTDLPPEDTDPEEPRHPMTDAELERMGRFWYSIMAGEQDAFRHLELD